MPRLPEFGRMNDMGLWINVITEHGAHLKFSYGGFGQFRRAIAEMAGFLLKWKQGFGGTQEWTGDEPFYYLLDHSDADGTIEEEDCKDLLKDFKKYREDFVVECNDKGYPDWILQMGADHVLPDNYLSELVDRMTDEIRIASGSYEGAWDDLNIDTLLGSGKLIDAKLWDEFNGMLFPEKYGHESWIGYRFRKEGYSVSRHDDLITEIRPIRMSGKKAYYWGKGSYALGGSLPFALLKAVSLRRHGLKFIQGYFSRKDVEKHEDIYDYVCSMQWEKARKQGLSILNKWRRVKI